MPIDLTKASQPENEWKVTGRFVFVAIMLFFSVIIAVNAVMMTLAIRTFPGADAKNGYDRSQNYNAEIAAARAQAERGWIIGQTIDRRDGVTIVGLSVIDREGARVTGLSVEAQFRHPTDKKLDHVVPLDERPEGGYGARTTAIGAGVWIVRLTGTWNGEIVIVAERRVTLP